MAGILGSEQWILQHSLRPEEVREELKSWLRFSLMVRPDMQLVVRRDAKNFDVADVVLSRCEVALAFQRLPERMRCLLWDVVCKRWELYEVAISRGIAVDSVRRQVDRGLGMMEKMIYEKEEANNARVVVSGS